MAMVMMKKQEQNVNIPGSRKGKSENLDKPLNCETAVTGKSCKMLSDWIARQENCVQHCLWKFH